MPVYSKVKTVFNTTHGNDLKLEEKVNLKKIHF